MPNFVRSRYLRHSTKPTLFAVSVGRKEAIWLMGARLVIYPIAPEERVPCPDPECQAGVAEKCRFVGSRWRHHHRARLVAARERAALEGVSRG